MCERACTCYAEGGDGTHGVPESSPWFERGPKRGRKILQTDNDKSKCVEKEKLTKTCLRNHFYCHRYRVGYMEWSFSGTCLHRLSSNKKIDFQEPDFDI